jgi:hypothetical protein
VWLKGFAIYLCPRLLFPSKKQFSQEVLLELVEKCKQTIVGGFYFYNKF